MQQVIMMTERHTEHAQVSQMRFDSDFSMRPVYPTLRITLLGTCLIASDHIPLTRMEVPRLQALLAYLVLHRGAPQSRTHLASMLWPDSTQEQAYTNLRNLLYKLRQALPDSDHYLVVKRHMLMWQKNDFWTMDVLEFERAVHMSKQAESMENHTLVRRALEKAMELYRGDLLPGCYDEWIVQERERFSQMFLEVLEKLLCLQEKEGDFPGAIRVAQHLLREDPLQEESYRHLMRLYAASGNRAAAVRVYQKCVAALERELAVEPDPETRRVYEQLTCSEHLWPYTDVQNSGRSLVTFEAARSKHYSLCECS
jgi:DNA-binding SARP family transcriptional activator